MRCVFLFGSIVCLLTPLSGCRVGNQIQYQVDKTSDPHDTISGYYVANPIEVKFYATTNHSLEKSATLNLIPELLSQTITNPTAFILQEATSGLASLSSPTGKVGFPVFINPDLTLTYSQTTTPRPFWKDPDCLKHLDVTETGKLLPNTAIANPYGNTYPLLGSVELKVQIITEFQGNCAPTFLALYQCYQDSTQCGAPQATDNTSLQQEVIQIFAPWVQSQTIHSSDIPNLRNFAYEVSYQ